MKHLKLLIPPTVFVLLLLFTACDGGCLHTDLIRETVPASCTDGGYTINTCQECGYNYKSDITDPLPHNYLSDITSATCDKGGYTVYTCECGSNYTSDVTSALGHDYKSYVTAPDCDKVGYTTYICSICDHTYISDYIKPLGHTIETVITQPTCTEQGFTEYKCTKCTYQYISDYVSPLDHNISEEITAPSCEEIGYTTGTCSSCGYVCVSAIAAPTGHNFKPMVVSTVSCTTEGKTAYSCECGASYESITAPLGHNFKTEVIMPTVKDMGYTSYSCNCGFSCNGNYRFYSEILDNAYSGNDNVIYRGIDISKWNHQVDSNGNYLPIDWEALKNSGVDYVILKIGSTPRNHGENLIGGLEPTFEMDYEGAKAAGLGVGVYYFTYSTTVNEIKKDAETILPWLDGKQFEFPIYLDIEDSASEGYLPSEIAAPILTEMCLEFFSALQQEGYYTGLYVNNEFLFNIMQTNNMIDLFEIWYARYPTLDDLSWDADTTLEWNKELYGETLGMWQYSMTGLIDHIENHVDFNYSYKDYPKIISHLGFNGFSTN